MKTLLITMIGTCSFLAFTSAAQASSLVYHGINSDITPGAPLNPNYLATAENTRPTNPKSITPTQTEAQLVRQSVIATATSQLTSSTGAASGHINFGDGSYADYSTSGGIRTVIITDPNGQTTTITFPI